MPATVAVMKVAMEPTIIALSPSFARSCRRVGAMPEIPPICMAMEEKFAKPRSMATEASVEGDMYF